MRRRRSYEEALKRVLLEIVVAVKENNQPVQIRKLVGILDDLPDSTVYSYCDALEEEGWAKNTKFGGFKAIFPTIKGFRIIGETPTQVDSPPIQEEETILVVTMVVEDPKGNVSSHYLYTRRNFSEVLTLVSQRDDLMSLYIKKEKLV